MYQTLLEAVLNRFALWPQPGTDLHFSCDSDGEVRQRGEDDSGTSLDFYPRTKPVRYEDRAPAGACAEYTVYVTEADFNKARQ
ncbi:hypothetical protein PMW_193 [Pseudomonas phage phiPMW]|uniref:Uncharacterized protein n=1 Tax=Pseudomonas phage phiPMW TaxID=1815582 RepID=A0A1S5R1R9_9CAUD|nr:hypothetical protein FDG97_gp157 [Pseudomonas phage phiPMW]ANA49318.1 hypothetical protein PMW_193 [Pseudomonas phage phiPMW]